MHAASGTEAVPAGGIPTGLVVAVRVGPAVRRVWSGREFVTGAAKEAVTGPVEVGALGLAGDEQGDLRVHGGPDKAILLYPRAHYAAWRADGLDLPEGAFFENLTLADLTEADVHLGDTWRIGDLVTQVTQPRRPCRTLADRWHRPSLPREVQATGRTGFYVRVLSGGPVEAGAAMSLVERPAGSVSAAEANRVMNVDRTDRAGIRGLLAAPELPDAWRDKLERRLDGALEDDSARLG